MGEESAVRRPSAAWIAALLLLAGLACLAALAVAQRGALAARLARELLASRGVAASLVVSQLGWRGARLEDLQAGSPDEPALTARRVELSWSLAGLRVGRFDRIAAEGVRLDASLDAQGIRLRGLPVARGGGDGATAVSPLVVPFEAAELRDFELGLETPRGPVALAGDGEVELAAERLAGGLRLGGTTPYGGIETMLSLSGTPSAPLARFEALARPEAGAPPIRVEAELRGSFERLLLTGAAHPEGDGLRCEIRGVLEPFARRAEIEFRIPETDVGREAPRPARLFPLLAGRIERAKGKLGVSGSARFEKGRASASVDIAVRDLDLRTRAFTLRRLNGVVTLQGPPLRTPPRQLVSVAAIEGTLPLTDGLATFELTADGILRLESASFATLGGRLRASGQLPLETEERKLALAVEGLDVETILASLGFEGLSGTGTLEGSLPLRQRGARVLIDGGRLRATAPGVLRYRVGAGSAAVAEQEGRLGIALGALEDLHYDELELEISGDTAEELSVKVHARGSNPGFQSGRPVIVNLDVQGRLADLVKTGQAVYRVPGEVEERVKRVLDQERR